MRKFLRLFIPAFMLILLDTLKYPLERKFEGVALKACIVIEIILALWIVIEAFRQIVLHYSYWSMVRFVLTTMLLLCVFVFPRFRTYQKINCALFSSARINAIQNEENLKQYSDYGYTLPAKYFFVSNNGAVSLYDKMSVFYIRYSKQSNVLIFSYTGDEPSADAFDDVTCSNIKHVYDNWYSAVFEE